MADEDKRADSEELAGEDAPKKSKKMFFILIAVIALGGGGAIFMMGGSNSTPIEEEVVVVEEAITEDEGLEISSGNAYYIPLKPFVVNFSGAKGRGHFLSIEISLMTRDEDMEDHIVVHKPLLRNELNLFFSTKTIEEARSSTGREKMRVDALKVVQDAMREQVGAPGVHSILFTNFVIQ